MFKVAKGYDLEAHFYSAHEPLKKAGRCWYEREESIKNLFLTASYHFDLKKRYAY